MNESIEFHVFGGKKGESIIVRLPGDHWGVVDMDSRKDGRWVYDALPGKAASPAVREALAWVKRSLADDARIAEDEKTLRKVLKCDPAELCRRQCGR